MIDKQASMIRITSERVTFLSIDIRTRLFFIANAIICTFFLSSQTNSMGSNAFYHFALFSHSSEQYFVSGLEISLPH